MGINEAGAGRCFSHKVGMDSDRTRSAGGIFDSDGDLFLRARTSLVRFHFYTGIATRNLGRRTRLVLRDGHRRRARVEPAQGFASERTLYAVTFGKHFKTHVAKTVSL